VALTRVQECACAAYDARLPWPERIRAVVVTLLHLFDADPGLAQLCLANTSTEGLVEAAQRRHILEAFARTVDQMRDDAHRRTPSGTAEGLLAGAMGSMRAQLVTPDRGRFTDLSDQLVSFIVLPYLGAGAARTGMVRFSAVRRGQAAKARGEAGARGVACGLQRER
jgi:hypothetical protein